MGIKRVKGQGGRFKKARRAIQSKLKMRTPVVKAKNTLALGLGFPKKTCVTHKYTSIQALTQAAGGGLGVYQFAANGMFDPDITGTGHQPMYFDQLCALYDHYCVIGSKIQIKVMAASTSSGPIMTALFVNDDTSYPFTIISGAGEQTTGKLKTVPVGGSTSVYLRNKWSAKKYFGKGVLANTELQGTSSTDPTERSVYSFFYQAADLTTAISLIAEVQITYIAVWKELKDLGQS